MTSDFQMFVYFFNGFVYIRHLFVYICQLFVYICQLFVYIRQLFVYIFKLLFTFWIFRQFDFWRENWIRKLTQSCKMRLYAWLSNTVSRTKITLVGWIQGNSVTIDRLRMIGIEFRKTNRVSVYLSLSRLTDSITKDDFGW